MTDDDSPNALAHVAAKTTAGVSDVFLRREPELAVVLGDRYELLSVMTAAVLHGIPVAHLHGGEVTEGAIDDSIRHAITKLSHLHLCANEAYAARIRSMGEEPWRVHVTGAPSLDRLREQADRCSRHDLEEAVGMPIKHPFGLLTYHPPTADPDRCLEELEALLAASSPLETVVVTFPGADPGGQSIIERVSRWQGERDGVALVKSLGPLYPRALADADIVLGNSSSGLVEAPTFGVPVVNVGDRQQGRVRWAGALDVPGDAQLVAAAVRQGLDPGFRASLADAVNPYGDGHAAPKIIELLVNEPLDALRRKRFVDQ